MFCDMFYKFLLDYYRLTMVLFNCAVVSCSFSSGKFMKLVEHWRLIHEPQVTLYSCLSCSKSFKTRAKGNQHLRQAGSSHWSEPIKVTNRNYVDPKGATLSDAKQDTSRREGEKEAAKRLAAEERRRRAYVPEAEVLYGRSATNVTRDEVVEMNKGGTNILKQRKRKSLLTPRETEVLDYVDDYSLL